jgi:hypothetical protein
VVTNLCFKLKSQHKQISNREWSFLCTPKTQGALGRSHIWVCPTHLPYMGITPLPGTDVTKKMISIYGHDDPLALWLMVKKIPAPPTKERPNMVPLDAIWFITFHRPERMMTQNGKVSSILICFHQCKTTNRRIQDLTSLPWLYSQADRDGERRCSIELGHNRFVQATEWKDEIRIDVREWEIKDGKQIPMKKGISLPLHRWKLLTNNMDFVDQPWVKRGNMLHTSEETCTLLWKQASSAWTLGNTGYHPIKQKSCLPRRE